MATATFTLKAHSFRALPTPLEVQGIKTYACVVPVSALPGGFGNWMDVNAREASLSGRVPKAIRTTLHDEPELFVAYNRGLAILAAAVEYDNQSKEVKIAFSSKEQHGVFDGGHTLKVILDDRDASTDGDIDPSQEAFCKLEIMTGVPVTMITDIVEARNTSKQVASKSLMNLDGRFQELKHHLGPGLSNLISWKENVEAPVDVREVIALLTTLDRTHYNDTKHPLVAYSGKEACLKHFESSPGCYKKIYPLVKDILKLWEEIQTVVPEQYNKDQGGRFGRLKGCTPLKTPRGLPITGGTTSYEFPNGYLYPIVASFRSMIVEDKESYHWGKDVDPHKLINEGLATKIFSGPIINSIKDYHNPNRTGKDANVWALAYQLSENHYLRI